MQGHVVNEAQELIADPVPELVEHLGLSPDEVVVLTKFCYEITDAPRQWWLTLQSDLIAAGWTWCKLEPCLMTLWKHGKLRGILCYHVDDVMIAGDEQDSVYQKALKDLKAKYELGGWEKDQFEMCGCRIIQARDGGITIDQTSYARAIEPIRMTSHRRA